MSEKSFKDQRLIAVGNLLKNKRLALGAPFKSREFFIEDRSENLFQNEEWISQRYLASLELGKNQMSLDKLIKIAYALETHPLDLFAEILRIYQEIPAG